MVYYKINNNPKNDYPVRVFFNPSQGKFNYQFKGGEYDGKTYLYPDYNDIPTEFELAAYGESGDSFEVRIWAATEDVITLPSGAGSYNWTRRIDDKATSKKEKEPTLSNEFDLFSGYWEAIIPDKSDPNEKTVLTFKFKPDGTYKLYNRRHDPTYTDQELNGVYNEILSNRDWRRVDNKIVTGDFYLDTKKFVPKGDVFIIEDNALVIKNQYITLRFKRVDKTEYPHGKMVPPSKF